MSALLTSNSFVDSGRRVVSFKGDLDLSSAGYAATALSGGFDVLDLSELEFLDSSGLRVLLEESQGRDPMPVVRGARGQVKRILELSGIFQLFASEEAEPSDGFHSTSPI